MFNASKIKLAMSTGLAVAGIGIAALAAGPAYAAGTTASVGVGNVLTLSGLTAAFTLSGAPATTQTGLTAVTMNVKTNNRTGYTVTVQAAAATMAGATTGNTDTIPVADLSVRNTATGGAYTPLSTTATIVAVTAAKSIGTGDIVSNDYQVVIPWVNADTYSVTLNYIAANN